MCFLIYIMGDYYGNEERTIFVGRKVSTAET